MRGHGQLGSPVEDQSGIGEVDAMLCEIRSAFGFIPFEHNTCYTKCIYIVDLDNFSYISYLSLSKGMKGRLLSYFMREFTQAK